MGFTRNPVLSVAPNKSIRTIKDLRNNEIIQKVEPIIFINGQMSCISDKLVIWFLDVNWVQKKVEITDLKKVKSTLEWLESKGKVE